MNKLDQYGFDWYNPPENIEMVSTMNLLYEAMFYRRFQGSISPNRFYSVYRLFDFFIGIVEGLFGGTYLNPLYINSTLNLTDRIERYNLKYNTNLNSAELTSLSLSIIDWEDLEEITGEDLTEFKDRELRTNEVFGVGLLTKMYKIVDAFKYLRLQSGGESHLIGEFFGQIEYTIFNTNDTDYTDNNISSFSLFNSYSSSVANSIQSSNSNAHNEFFNVFNQSKLNKITLTTQIASFTFPYSPNGFPTTKQWLYFLQRQGTLGSNDVRYSYNYNAFQNGFQGCPIEPKFSRGNTSNTYLSPTQVFANGIIQDITNVEFVEAYGFNQKSDDFDFGTGVILNDGGVLTYTKNQDNTMFTESFANFSDSTADFPQLAEPPDGFIQRTSYTLKMDSRTYLNFNDTDFNEYKTASANN